MICVELAFTDDQRRLDARPAHRRHLQNLHERGALLLAGPWDDDSGALLVFTGDRDEVDAIIAEDPYYRTPGVTLATVRTWKPIVGDGR